MDISKIVDIKELKAMFYDQMVIADQAQANLKLINQRIAELNQQENVKTKESKT